MSVSSISFEDEVSFSTEMDGERSRIEALAQKIQSIWGRIYDIPMGSLVKTVHIIRDAIGSVVRDLLLFPLKCSFIVNIKSVRDQLQIEENYTRDFWDPSKPLDPFFRDHGMIREKFAIPEDRVFPIQLKNGETKEITCRIVQTKNKEGSFYNFVQVSGIYGTISNNICGTYSYLSAFVNSEKENPLPPARFIIISENNLNFKPASLDEAGFVLLQTLKALREEFGDCDQMVAHSLGSVFLANALTQVDDPAILPKNICFDRGPISAWEASKKYFWGLGYLIYFMAKFGRWASDIERDIVSFCQRWEKRPPLLITGVKQDHYFSGSANLCLGEKINKIKGIETLIFDPPRQLVSEYGHHNMGPDLLNPRYLLKESDFMKSSENLAEAIIRHSLPAIEEQQKQAAG